jgi:hypothetical protein
LPSPEPVGLIAPKGDTVVHGGDVTFKWDSVVRAANYQLQIDDRSSFYTPVFDTVLSAQAVLSLAHFLADGVYFWRVRARTRDSVWGDWSQVAGFSVRSYRIRQAIRTRGYPQSLDVRGDYAYVADGEAGLSIYDFRDPLKMVLVANIMDTVNSCWGVTIHGRYAYLAYGRKQLQIVDIANLDSLKMLGSISYTTGYAYDIAALETNYVVVANHGKVSLFDVRDPNFPILLYEPHALARGVALRDSVAYLACEQLGLLIVRFSADSEPRALAGVQTVGNARGVALAGNHCLVADGREGLTIVDITNATSPQVQGNCHIPGGYANKVAAHESMAYVAAGSAGLAAIDISDPAHPVLASLVKTPDAKAVFATPDGRIFATDRDWGLLVVEKEME